MIKYIMMSRYAHCLPPEERLILFLSRYNVSKELIAQCNKTISRGINWDRFVRKGDIARTTPIIYKNIKNLSDIPEYVKKNLRLRYFGSLRHNLLLKDETKRIISALKERKIEAIPLKGAIASEQVFGDIALYTGSDIDILVSPSDLEETKRVLLDIGYREEKGFNEGDFVQTSYHLPPYVRGGFYLEIHWNLTTKYFNSRPEFWWEEIKEVEIDGERFLCLSPERYLLYTIFRLFSHGFYPLKFHVLIAGIIESSCDRIDWDELLSKAREIGMGRLTTFTLSLMNDFFDLDVPVRFRVEGFVMNRIKDMILRGLFDDEPVLTRRMIVYSYLHGNLRGYLSVLLKRLFPRPAEIRSRYGIEPGSKKVILYYLLNPVYLVRGRKR